MESEQQDPLVGTVIDGRYTIDRPLASGGMGSVYLAQQRNLARPVAVKVVIGADDELVERFRREADALAEVSHPAIVEVHDFIRAEQGHDRCYLVMSYVEGEDLEDYLERQPEKRLPVAEAVSLITPIVSALVQLHAAGIVHRDIKPANIVRFQGADGRPAVKLVDFGIARRAVDAGLTSAGYIIGTPPYMAPETLMAKPHTPVADVYAMGATLYELLTGGAPFGNGRLHEVMARALQEPVTVPPGLEGTPLATLLVQMLQKEEGSRPDALRVLETLERVQDELAAARVASGASLVAPAPAPSSPAPAPSSPAPANRDQATVQLTPRPATAQAAGVSLPVGADPAPHRQPPGPPGSAGLAGTAPTALAPAGAAAPRGAGTVAPQLTGPAVTGTQAAGPAVTGTQAAGPAVTGTQAAGPAVTGTQAAGPAVTGTQAAGPAVTGTQAAGPAVTGTQAAGSGAGEARAAAQRRHLWLWLGPLLVVPLLIAIVALTLVFGGFGRSGGGDGAADEAPGAPPRSASMDPGAARSRAGGVASRRAGSRQRAASAKGDTELSGRALGKACKSQQDAKRLFARAKQAARTRTRASQDQALRYYRAVLHCGHSHSGQRRWAARLMSNIYRNRGACRPARTLWRTYQRLTRAAGKRAKPFPGCH
jgi:serine/threonine-protein kinase